MSSADPPGVWHQSLLHGHSPQYSGYSQVEAGYGKHQFSLLQYSWKADEDGTKPTSDTTNTAVVRNVIMRRAELLFMALLPLNRPGFSGDSFM